MIIKQTFTRVLNIFIITSSTSHRQVFAFGIKFLPERNTLLELSRLSISHLTQICDIAQWRIAKQTTVLSAELGGAFIADLKRRGCRILIFGEHQPPRFVQTQPFLVLQRAHGRHRPEMMVEGRCTHIDLRREVIDTQRLCEVTLQPIDCPRNLLTLTSRRRHLAQTRTLIAHK